jgi:hypothetical protein
MELLPETSLDGIRHLAAELGISDWDVILVGDGSGSGWTVPTGWCCVLIDRVAKRRQKFYGGMNFGTSVMAELIPYVQALSYYHERRSRLGEAGPCRVHIITDALPIATDGQALLRGGKSLLDLKSNQPFWGALAAFGQLGYRIAFHHLPRSTTVLNLYADDLSKSCFAAMKEMAMPRDRDGREVNIYECNADDDEPTRLHELPRKQPGKGRGNRACPVDECA